MTAQARARSPDSIQHKARPTSASPNRRLRPDSSLSPTIKASTKAQTPEPLRRQRPQSDFIMEDSATRTVSFGKDNSSPRSADAPKALGILRQASNIALTVKLHNARKKLSLQEELRQVKSTFARLNGSQEDHPALRRRQSDEPETLRPMHRQHSMRRKSLSFEDEHFKSQKSLRRKSTEDEPCNNRQPCFDNGQRSFDSLARGSSGSETEDPPEEDSIFQYGLGSVFSK